MIQVKRSPLTASEWITPAVAKEWLRVDGDADDMLIASLITQVRELAEEFLQRSIARQHITLTASRGVYVLPYGPIDKIVSVKNEDGDDVDYSYDGLYLTIPGVVYSVTAGSSPETVTIEYEAGGSIPAGLILALKQVLMNYYENRHDDGDIVHMVYSNAGLQVYRNKLWF